MRVHIFHIVLTLWVRRKAISHLFYMFLGSSSAKVRIFSDGNVERLTLCAPLDGIVPAGSGFVRFLDWSRVGFLDSLRLCAAPHEICGTSQAPRWPVH